MTNRDPYYTNPCDCGANPAWHIGHTQACADAHAVAELDYAIAKATENIARATRLRLSSFAHQTRRERRALIARRDALVNA